jgi:hypothetical protein
MGGIAVNQKGFQYCVVFIGFLAVVSIGCPGAQKKEEQEALQEARKVAQSVLVEIDQEMEIDPQGPAPDLKPFIEKQLDYFQRMETGEIPFNAQEIVDRLYKVKEARENLKKGVVEELSSDVSFALGRYDIGSLLKGGKKALNDFIQNQIIPFLRERRNAYPGERLYVLIKTRGYADSVAPSEGLARSLAKGMDYLPPNRKERRKALNEELSRRRAQTIADYLIDQLGLAIQSSGIRNVRTQIADVKGLGEQLPREEAYPPYRDEDARRRNCYIYANIYTDGLMKELGVGGNRR